jgi:hypothetical protein
MQVVISDRILKVIILLFVSALTTYALGGGFGVTIDVKPGGVPNAINLDSRGVIPVAILTTDAFDAASVDAATVIFSDTAVPVRPPAFEDVDADGDLDLVFHFRVEDTSIQPGQTMVCLTGQTLQGEAFFGCDDIVTVPSN